MFSHEDFDPDAFSGLQALVSLQNLNFFCPVPVHNKTAGAERHRHICQTVGVVEGG